MDVADKAQIAVSAISIGVTAVIACVTMLQNYSLNIKQSQPEVVVYLRRNETISGMIEIVIKNFGNSLAKNIHLKISPEPKFSEELDGVFTFPSKLSQLAPGQEWFSLWDIDHGVKNENLPRLYTCTVKFEGLHKKTIERKMELDWEQFMHGAYAAKK